jgi:hypothetical protein
MTDTTNKPADTLPGSRHCGAVKFDVRTAVTPASRMKRLFAVLAFVMGGFSAELAAPLQCTLVPAGNVARRPWPRPPLKRREV